MHEVGLMSEALSRAIAAAGDAGASRIERLTFKYAPTGHVTPDIVETLFHAMSSGTIAEGARLVVEPQESTFHCLLCDCDYAAADPGAVCPTCRRPGMPSDGVPDLVLESIDIDG